MDEIRFTAQSCERFAVYLFKFEFKCIFVPNLLRMVNCKVFRKCIVFILVDYCILMLVSSAIARVT